MAIMETETRPAMDFDDPKFDRFVSGKGLMEYFDISRSTLRRRIEQGMPSVGAGARRKFHIASVLRWWAEHAG